jgi:hypothetical protein
MNNQEHIEALKDIKRIMERNERFISLSGWSGVAAGTIALIGAYSAHAYMLSARLSDNVANGLYRSNTSNYMPNTLSSIQQLIHSSLFHIALLTLFAALISAFIFTYFRSKKTGFNIWGASSQKLLLHIGTPLVLGGLFIIKMILLGYYDLVAASCLMIYGMSLYAASKYVGQEIKQLGIIQMILGLFCAFSPRGHLYFWALGFGVMHILYGFVMWYRYEREN